MGETSCASVVVAVSDDGVREYGLRSEAPKMRRWLQWRREAAHSRAAIVSLAMRATGFVPLPWQAELALAGPRSLEEGVGHKLAMGGFGAGKTDTGAFDLFCAVLANPGMRFLAAAPTYDQVEGVLIPAWERLVDAAAKRGFRVSWKGVGATSLVDNLVCGGRVYFRSYSKVGNLLGFQFSSVWLDELDTVMRPRDVWDTIHSRVRQPGAQWRQVSVTTTPDQGESGVAGMWSAARRDAPRSWYWVRGTALDNKHLTPSPQAYVDGLAATMSKREFAVKVMAEIARSPLVVLQEYDDRHVRPWRYDPGLPYDLVLDGGDQWPHYLWVQRHPAGWSIVFDEYCPDQVPRDKVRAEVEARCHRLGRPPEHVGMDRAVTDDRKWALAAFPGSYITWCRTAREQSVQDGLEDIRALLDPAIGEPRLFVAEHLTGQDAPRRGIDRCLRSYRYRQRADGSVDLEPWKDNIHDHGIDALRYWVVLIGGGKGAAAVRFVGHHTSRSGGSRGDRRLR